MDKSLDAGSSSTRIVSIGEYRAAMQKPALSQIDAYWEGLRAGRPVPLRADVDPRGIDRALENAFILERIAPGVARFRLAGMHLNDLMGMEVRGMPITAFFTPEARRKISDALEHVFEEPAKARFKLAGEASIGRPKLTGEMLLLPLKSDLGDISRALGCLVTDGRIGRTPRRFDVEEAKIRPLFGDADDLSALRAPGPAEPQAPAVPDPQAGFAEPAPAPYTAPTGARPDADDSRHPHLRLVHSREDG